MIKRKIVMSLLIMVLGVALLVPSVFSSDMQGVFYVYRDSGSTDNHYIPSGLMGDYARVYVDQNCKEMPQAGSTCIKVTYLAEGVQQQRWAGVYWQNPANNWGAIDGGYDLTGMKQLRFFARGEKGGEVINVFKIGGIGGAYPDTDTVEMGPVVLTTEWQEYTMDLYDRDLSYISGGFSWTAGLDKNPDGLTFYLDEMRYEME